MIATWVVYALLIGGLFALADRSSDLKQRLLAMKPERARFVIARGSILSVFASLLFAAAWMAEVPAVAAQVADSGSVDARIKQAIADSQTAVELRRHADSLRRSADEQLRLSRQRLAELRKAQKSARPGGEHASGAPGDPSRLWLRGLGRVLRSSDPVVIVDGVRVYSKRRSDNVVTRINPLMGRIDSIGAPAISLDDYIDPNSVQTIELLRGPSAVTLYGPSATNGVIMIATKQGAKVEPKTEP